WETARLSPGEPGFDIGRMCEGTMEDALESVFEHSSIKSLPGEDLPAGDQQLGLLLANPATTIGRHQVIGWPLLGHDLDLDQDSIDPVVVKGLLLTMTNGHGRLAH